MTDKGSITVDCVTTLCVQDLLELKLKGEVDSVR